MLRLHAWLGKDSPSPESWLHQQANYDLWQAKQKPRLLGNVVLG